MTLLRKGKKIIYETATILSIPTICPKLRRAMSNPKKFERTRWHTRTSHKFTFQVVTKKINRQVREGAFVVHKTKTTNNQRNDSVSLTYL